MSQKLSQKIPLFSDPRVNFPFDDYLKAAKTAFQSIQENKAYGFTDENGVIDTSVFAEFTYNNVETGQFVEAIILNDVMADTYDYPHGTVFIKPYASKSDLDTLSKSFEESQKDSEQVSKTIISISNEIENLKKDIENINVDGGSSGIDTEAVKQIIDLSLDVFKKEVQDAEYLTQNDIQIIAAMFEAALKSFEPDISPAFEYIDSKVSEFIGKLDGYATKEYTRSILESSQRVTDKNISDTQSYLVKLQDDKSVEIIEYVKGIKSDIEHQANKDREAANETKDILNLLIEETPTKDDVQSNIQSAISEFDQKITSRNYVTYTQLDTLSETDGLQDNQIIKFTTDLSAVVTGIKQNSDAHINNAKQIGDLQPKVNNIISEQDQMKQMVADMEKETKNMFDALSKSIKDGFDDLKQDVSQVNYSVIQEISPTIADVKSSVDDNGQKIETRSNDIISAMIAGDEKIVANIMQSLADFGFNQDGGFSGNLDLAVVTNLNNISQAVSDIKVAIGGGGAGFGVQFATIDKDGLTVG